MMLIAKIIELNGGFSWVFQHVGIFKRVKTGGLNSKNGDLRETWTSAHNSMGIDSEYHGLLKPSRWSPKEIDVGLPGIESYRNVTGTHLHIQAIAKLILGG